MESKLVSMETRRSTSSSVSGLETHLGYWLRRVSNVVSGEFARSLQSRQVSVAEWVLLRQLRDLTQATPGEMAETLMMTRGAISKIVDKLQSKGWIRSRIKPEDNRVQLLSLTRAGLRVVPELAEIADHNDRKFFDCLDPEERAVLRQLLGKVASHHQIREIPVE
jgi:DNA-binding MarR family transcriptional regulator